MAVRLREITGFLDGILEIGRFRDFAPNGLQVEASSEIERVVTGVSASAELLSRAVEQGAELVVVHHGLIWGPGIPQVTGTLARRLKLLLANDVSLAAYHLPLDMHPILGNNAGLADALGLPAAREPFGDVRGHALGVAATLPEPTTREAMIAKIAAGVGSARFVFPHGPDRVRRVGLCTGSASDLLEAAALAGCDLYVTGELAERAGDLARELGITLVAAGHVATEVYGPMRLADALRARFPGLAVEFVPVANPL